MTFPFRVHCALYVSQALTSSEPNLIRSRSKLQAAECLLNSICLVGDIQWQTYCPLSKTRIAFHPTPGRVLFFVPGLSEFVINDGDFGMLSGGAERINLHFLNLHALPYLPSPPNCFFPLQAAHSPQFGRRHSMHSPQRCFLVNKLALHSQQLHFPGGVPCSLGMWHIMWNAFGQVSQRTRSEIMNREDGKQKCEQSSLGVQDRARSGYCQLTSPIFAHETKIIV